MTPEETARKQEHLLSVVRRLPESARVQSTYVDGETGEEILLDEYIGMGVQEVARTFGQDVERRNLLDNLWEVSFVLDGVWISQLNREGNP